MIEFSDADRREDISRAVAFSAGGGGRKSGRGRMPIGKSVGWAIYAASFVIWLFGYVTAGHASDRVERVRKPATEGIK